nr:unnamed protein product [Haemonchus contortus]
MERSTSFDDCVVRRSERGSEVDSDCEERSTWFDAAVLRRSEQGSEVDRLLRKRLILQFKYLRIFSELYYWIVEDFRPQSHGDVCVGLRGGTTSFGSCVVRRSEQGSEVDTASIGTGPISSSFTLMKEGSVM